MKWQDLVDSVKIERVKCHNGIECWEWEAFGNKKGFGISQGEDWRQGGRIHGISLSDLLAKEIPEMLKPDKEIRAAEAGNFE